MSANMDNHRHIPTLPFVDSAACARRLDAADTLKDFRKHFLFPKAPTGKRALYFAGNSLGLQPKKARTYIDQELRDWAEHGVEGHMRAKRPWLPYHENLTEHTAALVGAKPSEVVVMNTLTVNLHLMMVSFYRPTPQRYKILVEATAFPSDQYAVASQARFHGLDPDEAVVALHARPGDDLLHTADIVAAIAQHRPALVLLGSVNYYTGQAFDIPAIVEAAHEHGSMVGFDLAHGAGNLHLQLHAWGPDFAVWCSYKYINAGPGSLAGCFVHERHGQNPALPRFAGWWGHDKATRFAMPGQFAPIDGAEGWQLSNPPIFQLAALRASMELFAQAGMARLRAKSERLTDYLEFLVRTMPADTCEIITPQSHAARGAQLSLRVREDANALAARLAEAGLICDARQPDVIRLAPAPLYNSFTDVHRGVGILREHVKAA